MSRFTVVRRCTRTLWRVLDTSRRVALNLFFLALAIGLIAIYLTTRPPALQDRTTLVLALRGAIVEQRAGNMRDNLLAQVGGDAAQGAPLRDVLAAIDAAAQDPKIVRVVLMLDELRSAGLPQLRDMADAIDRFKATGKSVVAWGSAYDQRQYYLAAHASEVLMHPLGSVNLEGYGQYRNYYRDALDRFGVTVDVVRVGTFKSFAEPYVGNGPSAAASEADSVLYNALWATYTEGVEQARKLPHRTLTQLIDQLPERLIAAGGDPARLALSAHLIDSTATRDQLTQLLADRGALDEKRKSFRQISFDQYLARLAPRTSGPAVGVVIAEGNIVDGVAAAGTVGGLSTAQLIRKAREDATIKAVVLRIASPGGSVFGSELVRRELELTHAAGKPVVVSMGNVAASGGYWIATAADEIVADAATVTGSIGVFALMPNASQALDKLGVHTAGSVTTWLGGAGDPRRPANPRYLAMVQTRIDKIYADFTGKVAQARKIAPQAIEAVAQGRVWTGVQAKERGLVDTIGNFGDAVRSAARRGGLDSARAADWRVVYIEPEPARWARAFDFFSATVARVIADQFDLRLLAGAVPPQIARDVQHDLGWLATLADGHPPFTAMVHCLCTEP